VPQLRYAPDIGLAFSKRHKRHSQDWDPPVCTELDRSHGKAHAQRVIVATRFRVASSTEAWPELTCNSGLTVKHLTRGEVLVSAHRRIVSMRMLNFPRVSSAPPHDLEYDGSNDMLLLYTASRNKRITKQSCLCFSFVEFFI
jgi:hypothetical protein